MADVKNAYGADGAAITVTLASLGSGAARESLVVDNTSNAYLEALVSVSVKTNASAPTGEKCVYVYAYATVDGGTTYTDACTGADAAVTLNDPTQLQIIGTIYTPAAATTYEGGPFSVARAFGGTLPKKWGIVVKNATGNALDATEGSHIKKYQGVYASVV